MKTVARQGLGLPGGSKTENSVLLSSVMRTSDGVYYEELPDLPVATDNFCMTVIDEDSLFIGGGLTQDGSTAAAYLFSKATQEWTSVGNLPGGSREESACGVARYSDGSLKVGMGV